MTAGSRWGSADGLEVEAEVEDAGAVGQLADGDVVDAGRRDRAGGLVGEGEVFMLEVKGDCLIDAAVCHGDWVVVRQQPTGNVGEIVAAMIDGEATVKSYRQRDGHVWLMPANPAFDPIPGDDATIMGRVVAVLRRV